MPRPTPRGPVGCAWALLSLLAFGCCHPPHRTVAPREGRKHPDGRAAADRRCPQEVAEGTHQVSGLLLKLRGRLIRVGRDWKVRADLFVFSTNGRERVFMSIINYDVRVRNLKRSSAPERSVGGGVGGSAQGRRSRGIEPATWRLQYPWRAQDAPIQPGQSFRLRLSIRERYGSHGEWERFHRVGRVVATVPRSGCPSIAVKMHSRHPTMP